MRKRATGDNNENQDKSNTGDKRHKRPRRTRSRVYGETTNSVTKLNNKFNNYNETRLVYYCCTWVRSYTKMIYLSNKIYDVKL